MTQKKLEFNKLNFDGEELSIVETMISKENVMSWCKIVRIDVKDSNARIIMDFNLQETISGCGLTIISGITSLKDKKLLVEVLKKVLTNKNIRAETSLKGCVIATLGESFNTHEKPLLEAGFVKVHTYDNIAHPIKHDQYQSIYLLDIPREVKPIQVI